MTWSVPEGFRLAAVDAGLAKGERPDLLLVVGEDATPAAACFTRNRIVAAPVALAREHLRQTNGLARAILVNAGFANAATGQQGDENAMQCATWVAERLGCDVLEVLVFSTGVIGQQLPLDRIEAALPRLFEALTDDGAIVDVAGHAIRTTDTFSKIHQRSVALADHSEARLLGLAKGSGMIHPDMATMLGFLLTDLELGQGMDIYLRGAVGESFHHLSVDGDTSTNDAVLLWTSARNESPPKDEVAFFQGLRDLCVDLAKDIARDGEGATKLIEVKVSGATTPDQATQCGRAIATSLLVRTAVHGEDPNWGRILAAAGRAGVDLETRKLRLGIGEATLFERDEALPENEPQAAEHLRGSEVRLWVDLGAGQCESTFWSCDLTADYVRINAEYRT